MRILKFGGKSLSSPKKVQNIGKYIQKIYKKDKNLVVVVSAMGQTTDLLIEESKIFAAPTTPNRELDVLLSTGETKSAALFAMVLNSLGVPAKSFQGFQLNITTFGAHQNSRIANINKQPILDCFNSNTVAVVAGFQGINKQGDTTTLGRGGSDTTACALAATFDTDVEIYSDFDGVFCGDPRFSHYKKLKMLNHSTMQTLALAGAKVIDSRAVQLASKFNTKIISKKSDDPELDGTIVSSLEDDIIAIASRKNLSEISIVFSDLCKIDFIIKNVINEIKNLHFYNFNIQNNKISFTVDEDKTDQILNNISKKLNLLK